jgi:Fic family protein
MVVLLTSRIHERILSKKIRLDAHRPLPPEIVKKIQEQMQIQYIYNSNAIEGNSLNLRETQLVIEQGITIGGKSLREYLEARNHPEALRYIEEIGIRELREIDIFTLHQIIMKGIVDSTGQYRTSEVRIAGTNMVPPPAYEVPFLMQDLVDWINRNPNELAPVELAAVLHHKFEHIHPFTDGNGRVGRLLMNLVLLRFGYPIAVIQRVDRKKYLDALSKADTGDLKSIARVIASAVEQSLDLHLRAVESTDEPLQSISVASKETPFSSEYLSLLARKGRIPAIKVGRNWMITKTTISEYAKETANRGPR